MARIQTGLHWALSLQRWGRLRSCCGTPIPPLHQPGVTSPPVPPASHLSPALCPAWPLGPSVLPSTTIVAVVSKFPARSSQHLFLSKLSLPASLWEDKSVCMDFLPLQVSSLPCALPLSSQLHPALTLPQMPSPPCPWMHPSPGNTTETGLEERRPRSPRCDPVSPGTWHCSHILTSQPGPAAELPLRCSLHDSHTCGMCSPHPWVQVAGGRLNIGRQDKGLSPD